MRCITDTGRSLPRSGSRARGSALTELAICMLPYCLVMLGVILLGQISLGKQEAFKAINWAASNPGVQDLKGDVDKYFFRGRGTPWFKEESPFEPEVDAATEEPVLPYSGEDIQAAATVEAVHVSQVTRVEDGEVKVDITVSKTKAGKALEQAGMFDLSGIVGQTEVAPEDVGDLSYDLTADPTLSQEVADTLGSWVVYSQARAGYEFSLRHDLGMTDSLPLEEDAGASDIRGKFTLGGETEDGEQDKVFACEAAAPNEDGFRGYHVNDSIAVDAITDAGYQSDAGNVDPTGMKAPIIGSGDEVVKCWDVTYSP